ncbi:S41 family peptidase [Corynebacterium coyleae]|uniref:S41 family peptidase n=1 Tax=Corynebacterium coyleae TaxID=53374 RepID=UPI00254E205D|nr:S41 family peptidase [Corynebacterium coyleae]MDK8798456.1 S41 family peptidase [Corynebacterium coyleae]
MSTAKKVLTTIAAVFGVLLIAAGAAAYVYGPTMTAMFTGTAKFMGTDTPKRYAATVLDLAEQGIYADSPEFAEASDKAREAAKQADSLDEIRPALNDAVQAAGGKHSKLIDPNVEQEYAEMESTRAAVERNGNVAWATVPGVSRHDDIQSYADTLTSGLVQARDNGACGVVVDLRGNDGGDMGPMVAGLSPVLPDGTVLEFVSAGGSSPVTVSGNAVSGGGSPVETSGGKWDGVPVAVLVDDLTASSGEATMLAFRGLDQSRSFGTPTAGYASANTVYDFPDGSSLMLTIAKDKARTGETFAEDPIEPDVQGGREQALQWLRDEHNCS